MSDGTVEHFDCLVCGGRAFGPLYRGLLFRCESCGFVTANVTISWEAQVRLYGKGYFSGEEYFNYCQDKFFIQRNFRNRLRSIQKRFPDRGFSRVLELGCAYGFWGELITQAFPQAQYVGFDVSAEAVAFARTRLGLDARDTGFLDTPLEPGFTDVFLWDVVEHLDRPDRYLEKIRSLAAPGAKLYLTTGDIGALLPRVQKHRWRMIHPPSHLHYFSRDTLRQLLERCGFRLLDVSYPGITRSVRQIFYSLFLLNKQPARRIQWLYRHIPERMGIRVNTFDIIFAIAQTTA